MDELKNAIDQKGGLSQSARELGVSRQQLFNWIAGRQVPVKFCSAVEQKFGVSRKVLRPNDWQAIWPELEKSAA